MSAFRLEKDTLTVREPLIDSSAEQSVELDYLLPDYCPDIFKILKTQIIPQVQSKSITGDKLIIDGISEITVWYFSEDSKGISAVCQSIPFSKTLELPAQPENPSVSVTARCYFENGRAVTPRRVDIRGGISFKITVEQDKKLPIVSGASGGGIQLHSFEQSLLAPVKLGEKSFHVTEDIEIPSGSSPYKSLLSKRCQLLISDARAISNRVICKGSLELHLLYAVEEENASPQTFNYSIPISQIVDLEGADEDDSLLAFGEVTGFSCEEKSGGETPVLFCEFTASIHCRCEKNRSFWRADDVYSTLYETSASFSPLSAKRLAYVEDRSLSPKMRLETGDISIGEIFDVLFSFGEAEVREEAGESKLTVSASAAAIGRDTDGVPFFIEKNLPFEWTLNSRSPVFTPHFCLSSLSYTIAGSNCIEVRPEIRVKGCVYESFSLPVITDILFDEEAPKKKPVPALRIYRGEKEERVWDIAKRYGTSMTAVMEENDLPDEVLSENQTLLIPIVEE